jgi:soluble lytic murein transglycosylase-like protein
MTRTASLVALIVGFACAASVVPVLAETSASSRSRAAIFENQSRLLDGRLSQQYQFSARLRPQTYIEIIPSFRGSYSGPYLAVARAAADRNGIPQDLFLRLVQQESGWNTEAVSNKGAIGLAQLMPGTAADLGVDPTDPSANLDGGARYLATQYRRFGNWRLALAAYNAGPEAVAQHNDVPPFAETQTYVRRILGR